MGALAPAEQLNMQRANTIRRTKQCAATLAMAGIVLCAASLTAQVSSYGDKQMGPTNEQPSVLNGVGIAQHLNQQLPLNLAFVDDAGQAVHLANYFGKKPAILALVYF